jgi:2-methylcitrate dehydratase PrpD
VFARDWPTHDPRTAALLNGIAGRAIEMCEGLRLASGQAALQVLPGVLAVSESGRISGREALAAFILGYDVAGRLCAAFRARPLAHQNGQASLLAAAAAGARVSGLNGAETSRAMRIATTQLLTPSYTNTVSGATALNLAGGMSGFAGALAPDLALAGFEAQEDAIEEALGQMVGEGFEAAHLLDELGERWEITRNYFRLYACCNPIHPALDCLGEILARLEPRPDEIERIDVATYRFASVMRRPDPPNYFAARYSLPHAAAVMVVRGDVGHAAMDDAALDDPAIAALRQRVRVTEDPAMTAVAPRLRPARVAVTLKNGRCETQACDSHRGDFQQPFAESEIRGKFRELARSVLTAEGVARAEALIERCEEWQDVREFAAALSRHRN